VFATEEWWLRFHETLTNFPHLLRLVHELALTPSDTEAEKTFFTRICTLPFTHLDNVSILVSTPDAMALQRLFSYPSIHRLKFGTVIRDWSIFESILERCSPTIRHLDLGGYISSFVGPPSRMLECVVPVQLHSLRLGFWGYNSHSRNANVFSGTLYPFDLSHVKALSIRDFLGKCFLSKLLRFSTFGKRYEPHVCSAVSLANNPVKRNTIDLVSFPNLSRLRMTFAAYALPAVLATLSTITSLHRIYMISIFCTDGLDRTQCVELDSKLSTLRMSHPCTFEFEITSDSPNYEPAISFFPALISRDIVRSRGHLCAFRMTNPHVASFRSS
jgi:hypothetical protein